VKNELVVTKEENQQLHMQLAEKERALQATKADLIETRLELQRTEERLDVRINALSTCFEQLYNIFIAVEAFLRCFV
jgi:septal ring factor EnvC (AmiA/AmiB activator)